MVIGKIDRFIIFLQSTLLASAMGAKSPPGSARDLIVFKHLLTCSICEETFTDPRLLSCGHTFCAPCLMLHHTNSKDKQHIACPTCSETTPLKKNGIADLHQDFRISQLREALDVLSSQQHSAPPIHLCSAGHGWELPPPAELACLQCGIPMCRTCIQRHLEKNDCKGHIFVPTEQLENLPGMCSRHEKLYSCYCTTCKRMVCADCQLFSDCIEHSCKDMRMILSDLTQRAAKLDQERMARINHLINGSIQHHDVIITGGLKEFEIMEQSVREHAEGLMKQIDENSDGLVVQLKDLHSSAMAELQTSHEALVEAPGAIELVDKLAGGVVEGKDVCKILEIIPILSALVSKQWSPDYPVPELPKLNLTHNLTVGSLTMEDPYIIQESASPPRDTWVVLGSCHAKSNIPAMPLCHLRALLKSYKHHLHLDCKSDSVWKSQCINVHDYNFRYRYLFLWSLSSLHIVCFANCLKGGSHSGVIFIEHVMPTLNNWR